MNRPMSMGWFFNFLHMNTYITLVLEVNNQQVAQAVVSVGPSELQKKIDYWWSMYGLRDKYYRVYYEQPSRMSRRKLNAA
jgi:hypothetical protein